MDGAAITINLVSSETVAKGILPAERRFVYLVLRLPIQDVKQRKRIKGSHVYSGCDDVNHSREFEPVRRA